MDPSELHLLHLADDVSECTKCSLSETRGQTVFSRGHPRAKLMLIGEAPGELEDKTGKPFVGPSGELLDKAILGMGLDRERDVYICNALKCRPPENRSPSTDEVEACWPYLKLQIKLVHPKVIVTLGKTATKAVGLPTGQHWRGQWSIGPFGILTMPTYHPAYLLREPEKKKIVGQDLHAVMRKLKEG
jgi:uracil-DNA glycosylase family 4